jgi:hypothetical protein
VLGRPAGARPFLSVVWRSGPAAGPRQHPSASHGPVIRTRGGPRSGMAGGRGTGIPTLIPRPSFSRFPPRHPARGMPACRRRCPRAALARWIEPTRCSPRATPKVYRTRRRPHRRIWSSITASSKTASVAAGGGAPSLRPLARSPSSSPDWWWRVGRRNTPPTKAAPRRQQPQKHHPRKHRRQPKAARQKPFRRKPARRRHPMPVSAPRPQGTVEPLRRRTIVAPAKARPRARAHRRTDVRARHPDARQPAKKQLGA